MTGFCRVVAPFIDTHRCKIQQSEQYRWCNHVMKAIYGNNFGICEWDSPYEWPMIPSWMLAEILSCTNSRSTDNLKCREALVTSSYWLGVGERMQSSYLVAITLLYQWSARSMPWLLMISPRKEPGHQYHLRGPTSTHFPLDKMTAIHWRSFQIHFHVWKVLYFDFRPQWYG